MRKLALYFLPFFCLALTSLFAEEHLASSVNNVDLYVNDLYHEENGHNYAEEYRAVNRNDFPVRVSIKLTEIVNADNRLIRNTIIIDPKEEAPLGTVQQKDLSKSATWNYQWQAKKDH